MTEEIIDREQLLAAFNELGVEEVDEAVSFQNQLVVTLTVWCGVNNQ